MAWKTEGMVGCTMKVTDMQGHGTEDRGNGRMHDEGDTDIQGHGTEDGDNGWMHAEGDTDMHVGSVSGGGNNLHGKNVSENLDELIAAGMDDMEVMLQGGDIDEDAIPVPDENDIEES